LNKIRKKMKGMKKWSDEREKGEERLI